MDFMRIVGVRGGRLGFEGGVTGASTGVNKSVLEMEMFWKIRGVLPGVRIGVR